MRLRYILGHPELWVFAGRLERMGNAWVSERDVAAKGAVRLFCLPHAGAGAAGFYRWRRGLPESVAVCPVQLPGRERRIGEPAAVRAVGLAGEIVGGLGPLLGEPYALFGHSMGSLLAYELARQIAAAGLPGPRWVFASGRDAPHTLLGRAPLHGLGDDALLQGLARRFGGAPDELLADPELRALFLPALRADLELVETYGGGGGGRLECSIAVFAGVDDPSVSVAGLRRWGELAGGRFVEGRFAGDHFYHLGAGQAGLLRAIGELLTR